MNFSSSEIIASFEKTYVNIFASKITQSFEKMARIFCHLLSPVLSNDDIWSKYRLSRITPQQCVSSQRRNIFLTGYVREDPAHVNSSVPAPSQTNKRKNKISTSEDDS